MSARDHTVTAPPASAGEGIAVPVIVIGLLALVLNFAIMIAQMHGYTIAIPIDIFAGFSFRVAPLLPAATALILAYGLWQYSGASQGRAWLAALCLFLAPIIFVQIWNAITGWILTHASDAMVTNSENFYYILFLQTAVSAASVMLVLAIAARPFRAWTVWLYLIVVWAGGATLLFGLYKNQVITMTGYQYLYPVDRVLGFLVLACYFLPRRAA